MANTSYSSAIRRPWAPGALQEIENPDYTLDFSLCMGETTVIAGFHMTSLNFKLQNY